MRTLISLQLSGNFPSSTFSQRWLPAGQQSHLQFSHCLGMNFIWVRNSFEISLTNILGTHQTTWWAWLLSHRGLSVADFTQVNPRLRCTPPPLGRPFIHLAPWGESGLVPATIGLHYFLYFQGGELVHTVNQAFFRVHSASFNSLVTNMDSIWYGGVTGERWGRRVETSYTITTVT